jgi:uncharacterized protein (DUF2147 family)
MRARRRRAAVALASALASAGIGAPVTADGATIASPVGVWVTQGGDGLIAIEPCGGELCGRIVGYAVFSASDPPPHDWQGRSQCGEVIIPGARFDGDAWAGHIINPRNGNSYNARFHVDEDGDLKLRGYLGIPLLGQTQTWTRYNGTPPPDCRIAHLAPTLNERAPGRGRGA